MSAPIQGAKYTIHIDPAVPPANGVQYVGFAQPNTAESEDTWAILRLTYVTDEVQDVEWAQGTNHFTNVWDSRAGYTYS